MISKYAIAIVALFGTAAIALGDTIVDSHGIEHATGYLGAEPGWQDLTDAPFWTPTAAEVSALPDHYDSREHGYVSPIRDQGQCGSCYAHSRAKAMEGARALAGKPYLDLAEQDILVNDHNSYGCQGGYMSAAFEIGHGIALESACPYRADDHVPCSGAPADHAYTWGYIGASRNGATVTELRAAVYKYKVIMATVAADNANPDWQNGGRFTHCSSAQIDHLVNIVGYDKRADGSFEFIVANSWGKDWGPDGGYFTAKKGCDQLATGPHSAGFITVKGVPRGH